MYFESKGEYEKAVQLFHKGGDLPRAMDLCFRAGETMHKKLPQGRLPTLLVTFYPISCLVIPSPTPYLSLTPSLLTPSFPPHPSLSLPGASRAAQAEVAAKASCLFEKLNTIAQELGADTSPQTLARCAEFLVKHKQFVRAIELYVMAKRYVQAIEMCEKQKVGMDDDDGSSSTDEMMEQLSFSLVHPCPLLSFSTNASNPISFSLTPTTLVLS